MRMTRNGISTTESGSERYEKCRICGREMVQYDYRTEDGRLFSCVRKTLDECRNALKEWAQGLI